ncbi:MAG: CHASE2 domain-containing protein, partial [Acidobacteria bacterium]|nr:CHASE2 domain-containing protein [Acidobacteriota bacterium]
MNRRLATIRPTQFDRNHLRPAAQYGAFVLLAAVLGVIVAWRAPSLGLQAGDALVRARGTVAAPNDIVIVAIDEACLARYGRFPWARTLLAQVLDKVAATQPRAIALDVLFSDVTNEADDAVLASAIQRAGNVIVAAQLVNEGKRRVTWLRALPAFEKAAAGVGHVNIALDRDGVARTILLRQIDDAAHPFWSMAVETLRVGAGLAASEVRETPEAVNIGARVVPVQFDAPSVPVASSNGAPVETVRAARLAIDYSGPVGAFAAQTVSVADLLDGKVDAARLRGKYVLIGATAALGDRVVSPFTRTEGANGNQNAAPLAGVEVLAHSLNTILRARFCTEVSDGWAFVLALLTAALMATALALAQGRFVWLQQLGVMIAVVLGVLLAAYAAFALRLIVLPVVPMLIASAATVPLMLLRRTWQASGALDARLHELSAVTNALSPPTALMSMFQPVSFAARRTFCPPRPIARDCWSSETVTAAR